MLDAVPLAEGISYLFLFAQQSTTWWVNLTQIPFGEWAAIAICLLLSAFFSASETSLTTLSHTKIQQLINKDPARYKTFQLWLDEPNRVLITILVGNNLVNILASALSTDIAQKVFGSRGVAIAVGVITLLVLISGEIVPKTYAKHHAQPIATRTFPFLRFFYFFFLPITVVMVRIAAWVVRLFGGNIHNSGPFMTEEDIDYMIDLGSREGVLQGDKEKLLQSILEFEDITIREVMVPRTNMSALSFSTPTEEVLGMAQNATYSRIPVYREHLDQIVGILFLRDLFRVYGSQAPDEPPPEWIELLRPPYFVPGTMKVSDLLREFQKRKSHMAIVVDEFGGTMGLVTLEDILEEIVGEIQDEYDTDDESDWFVTGKNPKTYQANAHISLRELEEYLDIEFPDEGDYETLGGFITATAGRVPHVGEKIEREGYLFCVLEADERHVRRVEIQPLAIADPASSLEKDPPQEK